MASFLPAAIKTGATSPAKRLLWSFAAALLILTWAGTLFKIRSEESQEIASVLRTNQNLARTLEEHTLRTLKSVDQAVLFLKFQYEKNRGKINIADYVREGMIISNIFNQLGVIDAHGQYILSNLPEHKVVDLSDREHFRVHMGRDSNQLYISKPVLGRASGKWSIQMTRRINNPDGSFGGVVVVSLDPYYFTQLYGDVELGGHGVISLVGLDGVVRARKSGSNEQVGQSVADSALLALAAKQTQGTMVKTSNIDGLERFYAFRRLEDYPLMVVVGEGRDEALAEVRGRAQAYVLFALLVSFTVLAFSLAITQLMGRLEASRKKAEEANRLKSEFLASMSHELRTPLNGIIGYAELLREEVGDESQREFADTIRQSGEHLLYLVNAILDQAKIEAGRLELHPQEEDCRELARQIHRAHLPAASTKGLEFTLELADDLPPTLVCDASRLTQVLNNLVHNGIKFTDTGRVTLSLTREHGVNEESDRLRFAVSDTGPGIPADKQQLIFEKFRQAESFVTRQHGGAGLGLALAKQLVELMGGTLDLHSTPGSGSEFYFALPVTPKDLH